MSLMNNEKDKKCGREDMVQNACFYAVIPATYPTLSDVQNSISSYIQRPTHGKNSEWEIIGILFSANGCILNHKKTQSLAHEEA